MPKAEWGTKRICPTSGRRFYDLGRTPIVSPYTGETVTFDNNARSRVTAVAKEKKKPAEAESEESLVDDDDVTLDDDVDDADVNLGDDVLEDDDDDDTVSLDELADVPAEDDS